MSADQLDLLAGPGRDHGIASRDTERAAASEDRTTLREKVLAAYRQAGPHGLSDYETSLRTGIRRPHSCGTRREELIKRGFPIRDSGMRRPTDSGRMAVIWILEDGE